MLSKLAKEIVADPKYTYLCKTPLDQETVNLQLQDNMSKRQGKMLTELYIPAISNALDLHIQVLQDVHGYLSGVNILPKNLSPNTKKVTILWNNGHYFAVVKNLGHANLPIDSQKIPTAAYEEVAPEKLPSSPENLE